MKKSAPIKALPDPKAVAFRFLICTSCSVGTEAPVFTCRVGHPVCAECCKTDLTYCPFIEPNSIRACQQSYIKPPMNLYKYIHDNSTFYCPHKEFGCPTLMKGRCIKEHLANCDYRNLPKCIVANCDMYSCELTNYHHHLSMDHESDTIVNNNAQLQLLFDSYLREKYPRRAPYMFLYYGARFVLVVHEYEERVAMWISLIHGPSTQQYKAIFRIPINTPKGDGENEAKEADAQPNTTDDKSLIDEGVAAKEENGIAAPIDEGAVAKEGNGIATPIDEGAVAKEENGIATPIDEGAVAKEENGIATPIDEGAVAKEENGIATPIDEGAVAKEEDGNITNGENPSARKKGEDRIFEHAVHPLSMPVDDIIDLCECADMPGWIVETTHLVKDADNRLILPFEIEIQCSDCNYDDKDITIGLEDNDYTGTGRFDAEY